MNQEKYTTLFQEADSRLAEILTEFSDTREALQNDRRFVRTRLLLAFSFLEILCILYNAYYGLGFNNRALLEEWLEKYCLIDQNPTYRKHHYIKMLTNAHLYKFRNAIVHAFGFPEPENGISITSPIGLESSDNVRKMDEGFKSLGHSVAFVSADSLLQLFIDGFTLLQITEVLQFSPCFYSGSSCYN